MVQDLIFMSASAGEGKIFWKLHFQELNHFVCTTFEWERVIQFGSFVDQNLSCSEMLFHLICENSFPVKQPVKHTVHA